MLIMNLRILMVTHGRGSATEGVWRACNAGNTGRDYDALAICSNSSLSSLVVASDSGKAAVRLTIVEAKKVGVSLRSFAWLSSSCCPISSISALSVEDWITEGSLSWFPWLMHG